MRNPRIEALEQRRDALKARLDELDNGVIERSSDANGVIERSADLNDAERAEYDAAEAEIARTNEQIDRIAKREQEIERSRKLTAELGDATNANHGKPGMPGVTIEPSEPIYREHGDHDFFVDIYRAKTDPKAAYRLEKYTEQVNIERASATSDLSGLVVPQYLVEKYQPLAVTRRTFLNTLVGTSSYGRLTSASVVIPKETTGPGMGAQSSENTAFSTANWASSSVTLNAVTIGGYADLSIQSIQLGQVRPERLFAEMLDRFYQEQDRQALWGSGTSGEVEGVFLADGTQTVNGGYTITAFAEHIGVVQEAASKIEINDERDAMYVLMTPRRWRALLSATDADGRPLAGMNGTFPSNVGAYQDANGQKWFAGIRVVTSNKVQKFGEDDSVMAVYHPDFAYFEESSPQSMTADQVVAHTGTVRYVTWGYMIFSPEIRVNSLCLIQNLEDPIFPTKAVS